VHKVGLTIVSGVKSRKQNCTNYGIIQLSH
jgi:hypothetical protein